MIKVGRLQDWLHRFNEDEDLKLVAEKEAYGKVYLQVKKPGGWERIDLADGSIQGSVTGRMSSPRRMPREVRGREK